MNENTEEKYYAQVGGQRIGPYPMKELMALIKEGDLTDVERIWNEGEKEKYGDGRSEELDYPAKATIPNESAAKPEHTYSWKLFVKAGFFGFLGAWLATIVISIIALIFFLILSAVGIGVLSSFANQNAKANAAGPGAYPKPATQVEIYSPDSPRFNPPNTTLATARGMGLSAELRWRNAQVILVVKNAGLTRNVNVKVIDRHTQQELYYHRVTPRDVNQPFEVTLTGTDYRFMPGRLELQIAAASY